MFWKNGIVAGDKSITFTTEAYSLLLRCLAAVRGIPSILRLLYTSSKRRLCISIILLKLYMLLIDLLPPLSFLPHFTAKHRVRFSTLQRILPYLCRRAYRDPA